MYRNSAGLGTIGTTKNSIAVHNGASSRWRDVPEIGGRNRGFLSAGLAPMQREGHG
jgi:hypothetical protein